VNWEPPPAAWEGYFCGTCGAQGVRLWRNIERYPTVLWCLECARKYAGTHHGNPDENGEINSDTHPGLVPAILIGVTERDTLVFAGMTTLPGPAVRWWESLPVLEHS
jgi:NADH pyrophosphatase NudC (nudix superfamily)